MRVAKGDDKITIPFGECRWGEAVCTHFWFSPKDEITVVVMQQHRPFIHILESAIKPTVYAAMEQ